MALTISQELSIIKGDIKPPFNDLNSLVYQAAIGEAVKFFSAYKDFDGEANPDAAKYLSKVQAVGRELLRKNQETMSATLRVLVSILGDKVNIAQVQSATDAQWESVIASNITAVFEIVGRCTKEEIAAYNAL